MKLTRGREMHIKMKKETWWGKEENRHAGSMKPDDDTRDGTGGLLTRQRLSTQSCFLRIPNHSIIPPNCKSKTAFLQQSTYRITP